MDVLVALLRSTSVECEGENASTHNFSLDCKEELGMQILVLLRIFIEFDQALYNDSNIASAVKNGMQNVKSVEIVWNGQLQRHFFHVPKSLVALVCRSMLTLYIYMLKGFLLRYMMSQKLNCSIQSMSYMKISWRIL
jgi:hypothetical protein